VARPQPGQRRVLLGIPLLAGFRTRTLGEKRKRQDWYENRFLPKIGPVALYGLLFTIVVLFALQGHTITTRPWDVVRIAAPLLVYFAVMSAAPSPSGTGFVGVCQDRDLGVHRGRQQLRAGHPGGDRRLRCDLRQALAGVVGPLIEVPVLVGLVYVALWLRRRLHWPASTPTGVEASS